MELQTLAYLTSPWGRACLRIGETQETELRKREKELGSGSSLSWGPWSFSYMRSHAPFVGCCSYLLWYCFCYRQPEVSHLIQSLLSSSSVRNAFYRDLFIKKYFLSSEAYSQLYGLAQESKDMCRRVNTQQNRSKNWNKKRLKEKRNAITHLRDILRHSFLRDKHCGVGISTDSQIRNDKDE